MIHVNALSSIRIIGGVAMLINSSATPAARTFVAITAVSIGLLLWFSSPQCDVAGPMPAVVESVEIPHGLVAVVHHPGDEEHSRRSGFVPEPGDEQREISCPTRGPVTDRYRQSSWFLVVRSFERVDDVIGTRVCRCIHDCVH